MEQQAGQSHSPKVTQKSPARVDYRKKNPVEENLANPRSGPLSHLYTGEREYGTDDMECAHEREVSRFTGIDHYRTSNPFFFGPQYGLSPSDAIKPIEPVGRGSAALKSIDPVESLYGETELPLFGLQYGIPGLSFEVDYYNESDEELHNRSKSIESAAKQFRAPNPGNGVCENRDVDRPANSAAENLIRDPSLSYEVDTSAQSSGGLGVCIICAEGFSTTIKPVEWTSVSCLHQPSVCSNCMERWIAIELDSKIWNQITCPECKTLLVYEDIQHLADPETFKRYEVLSFRNAISKDEDFVWCQNCNFGQLHTGGVDHPIVRCMKCGFRLCFRHSVPWHERMTCDEYDEMLRDPDGFKSAVDKDDEAAALAQKCQQEVDETMARELDQQFRRAEEDRQRAKHEEELRMARMAQEAEAARKRKEIAELDKARKRKEIKRRQQEEAKSLKTVEHTTKRCPGCQWPIEKNDGCSHMTCTQCRHEFCWNCRAAWRGHINCSHTRHF